MGAYVAVIAAKHMQEKFRERSDEGECIRTTQFVEDEGEEGKVIQAIEVSSADAEPIIRDFGSFTRKKPFDQL